MKALSTFVAVGLFVGCTGRIGPGGSAKSGAGSSGPPPGGSSVGAGGSASGAGGTGSGGAAPADCTTPHAPPLPAQLLSPSQYDNTVLDMLKVGGDPASAFGGGVGAALDDLSVELRANAAADVAHQAATALAQWAPCTVPAVAAATCEQQIIDRVGPQAYRHPLSTAERSELKTLFDAGVTEKDFATGVEWFLSGLLQSPDFLYQLVKVQPGEVAGKIVSLTGYELASRLSYFVWSSMPDDALLAAAGAGDLGDAGRLGAQLQRMVQDPRFLRGVNDFYSGWLSVENFQELARDDAGFTTDVVSSLKTSLLMSATQLYTSPAPNVASLFQGQTFYMNGTLQAFYGLPSTASATSFVATDLPGQGRHGILTHPGVMALLARPNETNPIARGLFVRRTVMCQNLPPPPANLVIPQLAPVAPGASTRDRLDQHAKSATCAACHDMIDPPGFAFEAFDEVGRYRTVDSGRPVDTSGTLTSGGDLTGAFATGDELLARIGQSSDVKGCFAQKYFEYATSRTAAADDQCSLAALQRSFVSSGDLTQLVVSIAGSDSFRLRSSEGVSP